MDALHLIPPALEAPAYVNGLLLEAAEKLTAEQLRAPLPMGQLVRRQHPGNSPR